LVGALLGATLIGLLNQSLLRVPEVSEFWRDAILGVLILAAVVGDMLLRRRLNGRGVSGSGRGSLADGAPGMESIRNA
jgi:rhamnose transport system permease protein